MHNATVPTRLPLEDGPTIDVDPTGDHLEVTVSCTGRARAGIALTRAEARRLAVALMDASAPSLADGDPAEVREHITAVQAAQRHQDTVHRDPEATAEAILTAEDQLLEARADDPFTSTLPNDEGPDFPATEARIFPSVEGHTETLDVLALLEPSHGLLVHVGGACLTADGARTLVSHLSGILTAAEHTPA